ENVAAVQERATQAKVPCAVIGQVGGERLNIVCAGETLIDAAVAELETAWNEALPQSLDRPLQAAA
ncbi:MAG: hypothetical protein HYR56_06390, partial [Acidobacteria bacterium]|nr:hypothetical protein [Acidobacteriota bacterium]